MFFNQGLVHWIVSTCSFQWIFLPFHMSCGPGDWRFSSTGSFVPDLCLGLPGRPHRDWKAGWKWGWAFIPQLPPQPWVVCHCNLLPKAHHPLPCSLDKKTSSQLVNGLLNYNSLTITRAIGFLWALTHTVGQFADIQVPHGEVRELSKQRK